jgi:hypothetical protein
MKVNSIVDENGQISKELVNDSLFVKFDRADYEVRKDFLNYAGEEVDWKTSSKLNQDLKAGKFKTFQEFALAKEKAGHRDFIKRTKTRLNALKAKDDLYNKYPELKTIPMNTFLKFFRENSAYELSNLDLNNHREKLKEERNNNL